MKKQKIIPVRMDESMHKELRKLAYLTEIPMAELIREGIKLKLADIKKVLTNSDIAI